MGKVRSRHAGTSGVDHFSGFKRRVLTVASPERIILFESAATGQMTEDSDLDLLVVEPEAGDTGDRSVRISRALGDVRYPVDVIAMSSARFEETKNLIGGILRQLHRGLAVFRQQPFVSPPQT